MWTGNFEHESIDPWRHAVRRSAHCGGFADGRAHGEHLTRGKSPDELPTQVERLRGDRDEGAFGLEALTGRSWDVCVDVSGYTPRQVRPSAEMLCAQRETLCVCQRRQRIRRSGTAPCPRDPSASATGQRGCDGGERRDLRSAQGYLRRHCPTGLRRPMHAPATTDRRRTT